MKTLILISIELFLSFAVSSQGCLPDGITFNTQAQIDNFQVNYPECTEIEGGILIQGDDITNLIGLNSIISVHGLSIRNTSALINLTGLDNLALIEGTLEITFNDTLSNLMGLENLTFVGGAIFIWDNAYLINLSGLDNVNLIGDVLQIENNPSLTSLNGLNNLVSVGGEFMTIGSNPSLIDLTGLDNLALIEGELMIYLNSSLVSFSGLESLSSIGSLFIDDNNLLSSIMALENISSIGGRILIRNNSSLTNLNGLDNVALVGGGMLIWSNNSLTTFNGLDNISSIGGDLSIFANPALTSLNGLNNLNSILGGLEISMNNELTDLTSLSTLNSIAGSLKIGSSLHSAGNPSLISLAGLENITSGSINNIFIIFNSSLETCDVQSICEYLASPNGTIEIHDNAFGCNSQQEVEAACEVGLNDNNKPKKHYNIYPNPTSTIITIDTTEFLNKSELTILNRNGQELDHYYITESKTVIDISHLSEGVYFVKFTSENEVRMFKVVKY